MVEGSYPWPVSINYITLSLPVGKCRYICGIFQSKGNEVRSYEFSPYLELQILNQSRSINMKLIQYMDRLQTLLFFNLKKATCRIEDGNV